jgi:hypothetical protein
MRQRFLLLCSFLFLCTGVRAQGEILWTITLNTEQILQTDKRIFNDLEKDLNNFLNNQIWTSDRFEPEERIQANLFLTIREVTEASKKSEDVKVVVPDVYTATMAIQSLRPIYGAGVKTAVLNTQDPDINFGYRQGEGIQYSERNYLSDLGQILAFYSYIILGMDYDTFSPLGGEPLFQKALDLYNNLPTAVSGTINSGWISTGKRRNRYYLLENITSPRMLPLRRAYYNYHRTGLDLMGQDVVAGRNNITLAIEDLQKANQAYPQAMYTQAFVDAKREEIIEIFKGATSVEQNTIITTMTRVDPSQSGKYREIRYRAAPGRSTPSTSRNIRGKR